ncbi:NACHT domain-containing protein [Thermomonospora echinospora]|uniref:NACHT domain-containing protein n=1 Tax=Thermomonospora echinospora TaxID=1992 RepID=A0A1H6D921_9ACTN|nr:NACHT domain-containing protein [Thermomonospora echinospora]SEG81719.1 NACHT domain-containing protein [Thermomonospora echinospora]
MVITASGSGIAVGYAREVVSYVVSPSELESLADRLAEKVMVVERGTRDSLLGASHAVAQIPFTVRMTRFEGPGEPIPSTLGALADTYLSLPARRMVIIGGPGAGKTVLTLELVLLLLARRERGQVVPVRFSLAEWDPETPLDSWLVTQITEVYGMRRSAAAALVDQRRIVPILDGLDEMDGGSGPLRREVRALDQINRYHGLQGSTPLVLTCRTQTYEHLSRDHGTLTDSAVASIEELTADQIRAYLERTLASRPAGEKRAWSEVLGNLDRVPCGALSTPWRLYLATTVYTGGRDPRDLLGFGDLAEVDAVLMARLVPAAAEASARHRYREGDPVTWLAALAEHLEHAGPDGTTAADILVDRLTPVAGTKTVMAVHWIVTALVTALVCAMATIFSGSASMTAAVVAVVAGGLVWGALWGGLLLRREVPPLRITPRRFRPRVTGKALRGELADAWWTDVRRGGHKAKTLVKAAAVVTIAVAPLAALATKAWISSTTWAEAFLWALICCVLGLSLQLLGWLLHCVIVLPLTVISSWFSEADVLPVQRPADPLRQDAIVSLTGLAAVAVCTTPWPAQMAAFVGLATPFATSRAWMRYLVAALVGRARGRLPLRPARFLAWAHRAGLLRVTGRAYQFRHRELQEWLAGEARRQAHVARLTRVAGNRRMSNAERLTAAKELARIDGPAGALALITFSGQETVGDRYRVQAVEALAGLGDLRQIALDLMAAFAQNSVTFEREIDYPWAIEALVRLDRPTGIAFLHRIIDDTATSGRFRDWASGYLANLDAEVPGQGVEGAPPPW